MIAYNCGDDAKSGFTEGSLVGQRVGRARPPNWLSRRALN
jgi:hypothetical protein